MPKLPRISGKDIIKILERLGFFIARQKGSHVVMKKFTVEGAVGCTVPLHNIVAVGTLAGLLKQAKISNEEFIQALNK
jgi:predicted RNA binding protein YcfA (HicA-like mRNA interferase family)